MEVASDEEEDVDDAVVFLHHGSEEERDESDADGNSDTVATDSEDDAADAERRREAKEEAALERHDLLKLVDKMGIAAIHLWSMILFTGLAVGVAAIALLLFTFGGFYHFVPTKFGSDFASVWVIPLILEIFGGWVLKWTRGPVWPFVLWWYGLFCLVITVFQLCSAIYGVAAVYTTSYAGDNYLAIGIWIALILSLVMFFAQIIYLYFIGLLLAPTLCKPKPKYQRRPAWDADEKPVDTAEPAKFKARRK